MITTWNQVIALLPILIIGITIIVMILSIACCRSQFRHSMFTIVGLILSGISLFSAICRNQSICHIDPLIYIDNFSIFYAVLIIVSSLATCMSIYTWLSLYLQDNQRDEFYLLLLISSMGGILLTVSNHLIILFLSIELISLPLCGLIGYSIFQKNSITSSIKYVLLSGVSSSFFLLGIAFIYAATGHLSFIEIKTTLLNNNFLDISLQSSMLLIVIGLIMMMVGFAFKLSCVPFHLWTPDIYQGASASVSMYLATSSKIAIIAILIRFLSILPIQYHKIFYVFFSASACCSMLFGSIMAIYQNSMKRILAYSSITNSGYMLFALTTFQMNNFMTQEAICVYLISYILANIGAFGIVSIVSTCYLKKNIDTLSIYYGLFWRSPILSVIFTVILLSLAGIPMTFGFIGKFYLLLIGINNQLWLLTIIMLISSIISMFYLLKIIINLYADSMSGNESNFNYDALCNWYYQPISSVVIFIAIIIILFGLYPQPVINFIYHIYMNNLLK